MEPNPPEIFTSAAGEKFFAEVFFEPLGRGRFEKRFPEVFCRLGLDVQKRTEGRLGVRFDLARFIRRVGVLIRPARLVGSRSKQARNDHEWVFRFAGDEFIILKQADSPEGLSPYLERVERSVAEYNRGDGPYPLSISYGVSFFNQGSVDAFLREMDEKMYAMKAGHHQDTAR